MTGAPEISLVISQAVPGDAAALTELAQRSKAYWSYPAEWLEEWRSVLTIDEGLLRASLVYVARRSSVPVGFYAMRVAGVAASLDHLWVEPRWIRQGIGRALLVHAQSAARTAGCRVLQIDSDPNAEAFYLSMGAIRIGTTPAPVAGQWRELPRLHLNLARGVG